MELDKEREKSISKKLSYVLRHKPDSIGIVLDTQGWTRYPELLDKLDVTYAELIFVVEHNTKQRFSLDLDRGLIRANQGHSVDVDLGLVPQKPLSKLFHGTAKKNEKLILRSGLKKMRRQHVHLSTNVETARTVGGRHGKPMIFIVDAAKMYSDGFQFYKSDNGVWLTETVGVEYLSVQR